MYALSIENVTKSYGKTTVIKSLSFTAEPGKVTGFLGPNGAGKSTLIKVLLDLATPDQGRTMIGGKRYRDLDDPVRTVGVFVEPEAFHPGRSGRNHLRVLADAAGIPQPRVDEMLETVGLASAANRNVGAYSLGMRQRLGLAAALLGDPPVLILDEPGNGLDPAGLHWLRDLLRARAAQGHTLFVSSHLLAEMEQLADDLVVINQGQLVATGQVSELRAAAAVVRTPSTDAFRALVEAAGGSAQQRDDGAFVVRGLATADIGDRCFDAGIPLHELAAQASSLEELFLAWTGDSAPMEKAVTK